MRSLSRTHAHPHPHTRTRTHTHTHTLARHKSHSTRLIASPSAEASERTLDWIRPAVGWQAEGSSARRSEPNAALRSVRVHPRRSRPSGRSLLIGCKPKEQTNKQTSKQTNTPARVPSAARRRALGAPSDVGPREAHFAAVGRTLVCARRSGSSRSAQAVGSVLLFAPSGGWRPCAAPCVFALVDRSVHAFAAIDLTRDEDYRPHAAANTNAECRTCRMGYQVAWEARMPRPIRLADTALARFAALISTEWTVGPASSGGTVLTRVQRCSDLCICRICPSSARAGHAPIWECADVGMGLGSESRHACRLAVVTNSYASCWQKKVSPGRRGRPTTHSQIISDPSAPV